MNDKDRIKRNLKEIAQLALMLGESDFCESDYSKIFDRLRSLSGETQAIYEFVIKDQI